MYSSKVMMMNSSFLSLLAFAFVMPIVLGAPVAPAAGPLFHFCSESKNFTAHDPYETSLNKVLNFLSYQTPPTGFAYTSLGQGQTQNPNKVYGLALCRGDVSTSDCKTCIMKAAGEVRNRCEFNKEGIIWYDYCLLKYSEEDFFGKIDNENKFYMLNTRSVNETERFNAKTKELLGKLSAETCESRKLYAVGETEMTEEKEDGNEKIYALTQCTRDLSKVDCKKCLDGIIGEIGRCCHGKEGGRVVGGSCNFRYEIYPFVNDA